ncbi:MAG: hypothetical protein M3256_07065 [Actinomycetota bacterium]|nr:hypothetical protein [Actinomycetota bacterium]
MFNLSPKTIVEGYADHPTPATLAETHRLLSLFLEENIAHNDANLFRMNRMLTGALGASILTIALWACLTAKVA